MMIDIQEYTYSKSEYYSEVNDFGDNYHEKDRVYETDDDIMNSLLVKLRAHKRKYTNFSQWCEAKEEYIEYVDRLVAKYGGKKRFKFLASIGMVDDYIPFCPLLKKSKHNRMYLQSKTLSYIPSFKQADGIIEPIVVDKDILEQIEVNVNVVVTKQSLDIKKFIGAENIERSIKKNIDLIDKWYQNRVSVITNKTEREQRVILRKAIVNPEKDKGKSFSKLMKDYHYHLDHGLYVEDMEQEIQRIKYRDISMTTEESNQIDIIDALKDIGVHLNKSIIGKKSFRLVKRRDEAVKGKKPKKKKNKKRGNKVKDFVSREYTTMETFSQDLSKLSKDMLARNGVISQW